MSLSSNFPTSKPSLNLDFANVGALDPRITFSRTSSATYTNSLGLIATAAAGVARFDYDPTTLAAKGLLVEEQRSNLCPYSEQFNSGDWTLGSATTRVANAGVAPNGETTADKIYPASSGTFKFIFYNNIGIGLSANSAYVESFFVKASGKDWCYIRFEDQTNTSTYVYFNLSTGTIGSSVGTVPVISKIENYGNGWYRCSVSGNVGTGGGGYNPVLVGPADADGSTFATASGTDGILLWGAQLEAGSFATSYIPTVASAVTRTADVASVNTLSPWYSSTESTIFAEYDTVGSTNNRVFIFDDTGAASYQNYVALSADTTQISIAINVSGSTQAQPTVNIAGSGTQKAAGGWKANDFGLSANGGSVATDTSGTIPTLNKAYLGYYRDGTYLNGHLRRLAYYPRKLSSAELQALSA